jgi:putative transposase
MPSNRATRPVVPFVFSPRTRPSLIARKPQQNGFIESLNGSLRDELLNEEIFDTLDDARRKLALWRYDYNNVRPHSSLRNQTPAEARRALQQIEGSAHDALAQNETTDYKIQTRKLSL